MRTLCDWTVRRLGRIGVLVLVSWMGVTKVQAASLDPALLPKIQAATFEVVQAKPTSDPLTYEKPLPLDLLPFQERTDKYYSTGTAFAIGHGRYVTAGHVLMLGLGSLWGPPELRDGAGHVYPIARIEKFSLRQDFVVFTLARQPPGDAALDIDRTPSLNQVVYAVGNALGTGVVVRDGLYTSDTPEQQDGAWKWMRFSAAASPGNSGGPLLDKDGKVIGVVLMKSPNENLNYALPIRNVLDAPDDQAVIDRRIPYQFDLFDSINTDTFKAQFALPMSLDDFFARYAKLEDAYVDGQLRTLLAKEPDRTFPNGAGSNRLLHSAARMDGLPALIVRDGTGNWDTSVKAGPRIPLPDNGYVAIGLVGQNLLFHLRKPDDVAAAQLYADPQKLTDMLLKMGYMHRVVGTEKVKITSLGKPTLDTMYTDRWRRHWQVRAWPVPYANAKTMVLTLPVPDGYVGILRDLPASRQHDYLINLEAMTDFFDAAYEGTLAQWQDFLKNRSLLPAAFAGIKLDIDYDHRFGYASPYLRFDFTPQVQGIDANSLLMLGFKFFPDNGKVTWNVSDVHIWKDKASDEMDYVDVERVVQPTDDLDDNYKSAWRKISQREHPYDAVSRNENDMTLIDTVANAGAKKDVLYVVSDGVDGAQSQADMKARLDLLTRNLQVTEH